ncbi:uncharacterized protein LOC129287609 [Prosopis cineraria]|uniref:uncharacterized protein LOC129287609 n=1 Tax=Prosopis cineraria TaxID=364024 RepID=UPI00241091F2|nr:uncharacterized protein LOC129287609 [Prosopis cineraria]
MLVYISRPSGRCSTIISSMSLKRESEESDHPVVIQKEVQRFCFVKILPKHGVDAESLGQEAVRLFEEKDLPLLQISETIRERVLNDREDAVSRLQHLKRKNLNRLKERIGRKKDSLIQLFMALDNMSFPKCSSEEKLEKHKLNFRMQHKTKNLAQEKQLFIRDINLSQERNNASISPVPELQFILSEYCHHHDNRKKCDKRLEEIKQFEVTRTISKGLRETVKNQIKVVCDELMEMRKKKKGLEARIKVAEKELDAINEEIWSFQNHLKDKHHRKEASLFFLKTTEIDNGWVLKYGSLDNNSIHFNTIFAENVNGDIKILFSVGFPY